MWSLTAPTYLVLRAGYAKKMQFLKSKVKGEAERLIQHLEISSDNYIVSWNILNHRYDNKKLIFTSYINMIFDLPNMKQASYSAIKRLHDVTQESLNCIRNLGVGIDTWDPIIVHILAMKLDQETHADYIKSLEDPRSLPELDDFMSFLESTFTSMEASRRKGDSQPQQQQQAANNQRQQQKGSHGNKWSNNKSNKYDSTESNTKSFHVSRIKCPYCKGDHGLYSCKTFLEMPDGKKIKTLNKLRICINCLFSHNDKQCTSTKRCRVCSASHNTLLHDACQSEIPPQGSFYGMSENDKGKPSTSKQQASNTAHVSQENISEILLATAQIKIRSADGTNHVMRALVDQGSQISLITEHAAQTLGLKRGNLKAVVTGVGQKQNNCKGVVNVRFNSMYSDYELSIDCVIMKKLIKNLPYHTFAKPMWQYIENITLADPEFYISRPIDLILGAEVYQNIIMGGIIKGENETQPLAQQTQLGWLLCGSVKTYQCNVILNNIEDIKQFWETEEIVEDENLTADDQHCIDFYEQTTFRQQDGRYVVRLPMKEGFETELGASKHIAVAQFKNLERKMLRQQDLAKRYREFMMEYQDLHHMEPDITNRKNKTEYYLPHHGVLSATKFRVVFNGSSKTASGKSLNDLMFKGPNLQQDLQSLLIKWRQYKFALNADIEKMYRMVLIQDIDQHLQKIIWRDCAKQPLSPLQSYVLTTISYGLNSAPFLAMCTLKRLAADERHNFPEAAKVLEEAFYMDDLVHGVDSIEQGKQLVQDLNALLKSGGFVLRKWTSNEKQLLEALQISQKREEPIFNFKSETTTTKTLGLGWSPAEDTFTFSCNICNEHKNTTKRSLLSDISKLYDPLGWLAPVTTSLKILFQKIWATNIGWDDIVPENISREWAIVRADIQNITYCKVPRWIGCHPGDVIQLHGFCDASNQAYAGVVYARILGEDNQKSKVIIVASKSKLVPLNKTISLPRLELNGAQLLSKLMSKIVTCLQEHNVEVYGWSDSMIVLSWLKGDPGKWKPYVANRVQQITKIIPPNSWRYVNTTENPADAASRGLLASQLINQPLWWRGPEWLESFNIQNEKLLRPEFLASFVIQNEELRPEWLASFNIQKQKHHQNNINEKSIIDTLLDNKSSIAKATRILAWIRRAFIPPGNKKQLPSYLTLPELNRAMQTIVKHVQCNEFKAEIGQLRKHEKIQTSSKLLSLNPYLDEDGVLRVGGRLEHADLNFEMKHPKILPHDSRLTQLLIDQAHQLTLHGGPRLTLAFLRQQYWVIGGNRATKKQIQKCVICKRNNPRRNHQLMGDLPEARVNQAKPFSQTGVDYTGFVEIKSNKGRGTATTKGYVAVFICMVTKAVHLEIVSDLTSSAFLAALRRMAARRGTPAHIYSDNGTNFIKADRMLQQEFHEIQKIFNKDFFTEITDMKVQWHFNCPTASSFGGLWERSVGSLKHHIRRVVGQQKLTFEEWSTILAQVEASLNTRPLCALTEDVEDLDFLTPAHFLAGRPGLTVLQTKEDARTRWHLTQKLLQDIWKRWKAEYLCQLTARRKWMTPQRNIQIGDLVVIHEDNLPIGKWALGRVVDLHPGQDGYVRVVTLKTANGLLKRPVMKLSVLPIDNTQSTRNQHSNESDRDSHESDTESERETITPQNKTKTPRFTSNSITMTIIILLAIIASAFGSSVNITELNTNQSLYFDSISKMQLIKDRWNLVVYYNMSPYWEGVTTYNKLCNYIQESCACLNINNHCNMILPQLSHDSTELEYYNQLLLSQHYNARSRPKRGLINGIGYIANTLFGVLDERFAEKYARDIELIQQNQAYQTSLWKNQTSVIESEYNLLKRTEQIMTKQHQGVVKHFEQLESALYQTESEINQVKRVQDFTITALSANNLMQNLRRMQDTLLDTIADIYHDQYNIHLLSPEQLQEELSVISRQLSDDVTLPIDNIPTDLLKIFKLLKVKSRVTEKYILFEVTFPLIYRESYKLYNLVPIPHQIDNNMVSMIPTSTYLAINLKKDSFIRISADEVSSCIHHENILLCQYQKPIYQLTNEKIFCKKHPINGNCQFRRSLCQNVLIALSTPSSYLFACCDTYEIRILCGELITVQKLQKASIIHLKDECMIKGQGFTLLPHRNHENRMDIQPSIISPKMDPINNLFKISIPTYEKINNTDSSEVHNALENINKQIKQMKEISMSPEVLSPHDVHQYAVSYTLVGVLVAGGVAVLAWRYCRRAARQADVELQPVARARRLPSQRASVVLDSESASARMGNINKADRQQPSAVYTSERARSARMGNLTKADAIKPEVKNVANSPIFNASRLI